MTTPTERIPQSAEVIAAEDIAVGDIILDCWSNEYLVLNVDDLANVQQVDADTTSLTIRLIDLSVKHEVMVKR